MYFRRLLVVLVLPLSACESFEKAHFNQGDGLWGERVLLVPFSEPKNYRGYNESENGRRIVHALRGWAQKEHQAEFAEGKRAEKVLDDFREWDWQTKSNPARAFAERAAELQVRYIVLGELRSLRQTLGVIGLADYQARVSYRVIDVLAKKTVFLKTDKKVRVGGSEEDGIPMVDLGTKSEEFVKKRLIAKLGVEIGKDLYGYYRH